MNEVLNLVTGNVPMLVVTYTVAIKMSTTGKLEEVCIQEFFQHFCISKPILKQSLKFI